jgi:hypothetical protein
MQGQGKEIASIDFADIIGGPLIAVITAQGKAAVTTTNFIQSFAFTNDNPPKLQAITFDFQQAIGFGLDTSSFANNVTTIKVPLLTIIPIPYLRVDSMTIEFNVNLHSTQTKGLTNDFAFSSSASGSYYGITFGASVSDRLTYQNNSTTDDTYSMKVTVHAVQDQMPGGMSQVLNIFSNIVQSQATLIQTIVAAQTKALTDKAQAQLKPAP